jgi:hypothetical protein
VACLWHDAGGPSLVPGRQQCSVSTSELQTPHPGWRCPCAWSSRPPWPAGGSGRRRSKRRCRVGDSTVSSARPAAGDRTPSQHYVCRLAAAHLPSSFDGCTQLHQPCMLGCSWQIERATQESGFYSKMAHFVNSWSSLDGQKIKINVKKNSP